MVSRYGSLLSLFELVGLAVVDEGGGSGCLGHYRYLEVIESLKWKSEGRC